MKILAKFFGLALSNFLRKKISEENIGIVTPDGQSLPLEPQNTTATHTLVVNDWSFFWDIVIGYDLGLPTIFRFSELIEC